MGLAGQVGPLGLVGLVDPVDLVGPGVCWAPWAPLVWWTLGV